MKGPLPAEDFDPAGNPLLERLQLITELLGGECDDECPAYAPETFEDLAKCTCGYGLVRLTMHQLKNTEELDRKIFKTKPSKVSKFWVTKAAGATRVEET